MPARPVSAPNRILVQDGVYDAFTKRLAETAGAMKVAGGLEPGAVIGPLIDMAVEKVEAHIADAVKKGAKVVSGGKRAARQHKGGAAASSSRPC
jgi:succinate-semialdehyde dehydrogenase / glutarate-semialdehyde dehydrogenase